MTHSPKRKNDAVLRLCQNNLRKSIEITEANEAVQELLGYSAGEMRGHDLREFLPQQINAILNEDISFQNGGADLSEVLRKARNFGMRNHKGEVVPLAGKVYCSESADTQQPRFELLIREKEESRTLSSSDLLASNLKGYEVMDEASGLPNADSFQKDLEMVQYQVSHNGIYASLAVMVVDNYDQIVNEHGQEAADAIIREFGLRCKKDLRLEDNVARLSQTQLGLLLLDADYHAAGAVLNRLRWKIGSQPVQVGALSLHPTVSIGYGPITPTMQKDAMFHQCNAALASASQQGGNHIQMVARGR